METTTNEGGHKGLKVLVIVGGLVLVLGAGAYIYAKRSKSKALSNANPSGSDAANPNAANPNAVMGGVNDIPVSPTIANKWKGELGQNDGVLGLQAQSALKDAWINLYKSNVKGTKDAEIKDAWQGHDKTWYSVRPEERRKRDERIAAIEEKYSRPAQDSPLFPYSGSPIWDKMGDFIFNMAKKSPAPSDLTAFEDFMNSIAGKYGTDNAWFVKVAMSKVPYLRLYVPYVK